MTSEMLSDIALITPGTSPKGELINSEDKGFPFFQGSKEFQALYPRAERFTEFPVKVAKKDDILISVRAPVGQVNLAPQDVAIGRGVMSVRPKQGADRFFIFYLLKWLQGRWDSLGSTGSVFENLSVSALSSVEIPKVENRETIGRVLFQIDCKIQENSRISKTLEEVAQTIFRSWFVDFDPVKAKMVGEKPVGMDIATAALFPDAMEDSELGPIPAGWSVEPLSDIGEFRNGLAMQKYPVVDEEYVLPVIKIAQLRAGNTDGADMASGLIDPKFVISDGDILFSWSGTLEIEHWAGGQGALNQHLFKVLGKTVPDWFVYYSSRNHLPEFRRIASGKATTMGHIQRGHLAEAKVAVPPMELLTAIGELLSSLVSQKVALVVQNRALAELRDALLPRLISGELQIPEEMLVS